MRFGHPSREHPFNASGIERGENPCLVVIQLEASFARGHELGRAIQVEHVLTVAAVIGAIAGQERMGRCIGEQGNHGASRFVVAVAGRAERAIL